MHAFVGIVSSERCPQRGHVSIDCNANEVTKLLPYGAALPVTRHSGAARSAEPGIQHLCSDTRRGKEMDSRFRGYDDHE